MPWAKVYAGHQKEICWSKLSLSNAENNPLASLADTAVLHWHGDTFDLPEQAELLASSADIQIRLFQLERIFWLYNSTLKLPQTV